MLKRKENVMNSIEAILREIEVGSYFDSHMVINRMIRDFSDDYLRIAQNTDEATENLTLRVHQSIGHMIAKFKGELVERQDGQSWSMNIHGSESLCALWKRI
jgi:hypothetical protein